MTKYANYAKICIKVIRTIFYNSLYYSTRNFLNKAQKYAIMFQNMKIHFNIHSKKKKKDGQFSRIRNMTNNIKKIRKYALIVISYLFLYFAITFQEN